LASPQYLQLCARYQVDELHDIHPAFVNEDRLQAAIYKQRLLQFPDGMGLQGKSINNLLKTSLNDVDLKPTYAEHMLGVCRELARDRLRPEWERFIRQVGMVEHNPENWFVICFTLNQAVHFLAAKTVQMDLSFKLIAGNIKTFTITGWNSETSSKKSIPV